jgi:hypothetical protein
MGMGLRRAVPCVRPGRGARGGHQFAGLAPGRDRVDADVRGMALWPLLEKIASDAGWRIYVEPGVTHVVSAKFKNLPSGDALKMLFGDLNFALVPQTNAVPQLYVFRTERQNATQQVRAPNAVPRHVPNELLVKLKPGADIDALAKLIGAKVIGRDDKLGIYRLQFANADATDAALASLKNNPTFWPWITITS